MIKRLLYTLLMCTTTAHAASAGQPWNFRVYLDDTEIGFHNFTLQERGPDKILRSEARFNVKFLFLNAYSYRHTAEEQWRGDCLSALSAQTNDGGKKSQVTAATRHDQLQVTASKALSLPGCVMTFAYWNPVMLRQQRLLNPQTGEYVNVTVTKLPQEQIAVQNKQVTAQRYRLNAPQLQIDLWYSAEGEWLALESLAKGNRRLSYRRT